MIELLLGDCQELIQDIPDNSIDLIFTDPPYEKKTLYLYDWLAQEGARVLKPGGFLMAYAGSLFLDECMISLSKYLEYFMISMTYEPGANAKVYYWNIIQMSKPMLIFAKPPSRPAYHMMCNVYTTRRDKRYHKWGQDAACAGYYIHCLSRPGDMVLDPFAGGGTTLLAAMVEGRDAIGCELDPLNYERASKRLQIYQPKLMETFHQVEIGM